MQKNDVKYQEYLKILKKELIAAFGCTEPIALAYCAAKARETLGNMPEKVELKVCGNIIKNAKSVVVPNTGGLKGIEASVAAGLVAGKSSDNLEVLAHINEEEKANIRKYIELNNINVSCSCSEKQLFIDMTVFYKNDFAHIVIADAHTNIVLVEKNTDIIFKLDQQKQRENYEQAYGMLTIADIVDFANSIDIEDVRECIEKQIEYNTAIAKEGLKKEYGANIGKVLLNSCTDSIMTKAIAAAAAGSDARMSGCELPVVIVSGSGNQGMTASLPVIEYANDKKVDKDKLIRAIIVSDLITIHQKTGIGKLSAYCGAISAAVGAAAGVAYLDGADTVSIANTVVNGMAISSGIVCDGAKPSCAGKIATALYSALLGYNMCKNGQHFCGGDGIVACDVEKCIKNVGRLAKEGMRETDEEIIKIMTEK